MKPANQGQIDIIDRGNCVIYSADKAAREKIMTLSDKEFEREIEDIPQDL